MPNIPCSPNVQRGGGNSSTIRNTTDLANQIINDEEDKGDDQGENLDGRAVDDSICTTNTTPTPDTPFPDSSTSSILVEVLCQLATVTTKLVATSSLAPPRPRPAF
ncbi:hypothetical protein PSTG_02855 [Puccinia striiformis f. sp. tritici PST-78]|uniref:Uncharacterized protein n=1 Tax=Puccinia striiformis f. sp. tritici PST-78 TaxID=1165861 RepID=A0A0L0VWW0_9BASI|nr:hypothetical protein PSTG_02855 [Puccinia striiformis f. sp. tritici PST-78]